MDIRRNIANILGWRTSRRLVVIESDDWGSIRMPSLEAYEFLKKNQIKLDIGDAGRYNKNDTLATSEDFSILFETLKKNTTQNGSTPVFTALSVVANPNFDKIKMNGFHEYYYEPFTKTLEKYGRGDVFNYWKEGYRNNLFIPEFHGREHLNVATWMRSLKSKNKETHLAFNSGCWGIKSSGGVNFQAAFDLEIPEDLKDQEKILESGLKLFEDIHGYKARYFVPPNGYLNNNLEKTTAANGLKYICASKIQIEPLGHGKNRKVFHYIGQVNKFNQVYLTRNAFFEPNKQGIDWVSSCLKDISIAFRWKKPAVISTHRTNYTGNLSLSNRNSSFASLNSLLKRINKIWPDVEYLSSSELGDLISKKSLNSFKLKK